MKINLGAGNLIEEGYINHDLESHRDEILICFDLNAKDWKDCDIFYKETKNVKALETEANFKKGEFDEIRAWDVIEHLNDPINFMNNCWDLLKKDGILHLKACGWQNPNFYVDITHKKAYDIKSFDYFDPDTSIGKEYGYYTDKRWKILEKDTDRKGNIIIKLTPRGK